MTSKTVVFWFLPSFLVYRKGRVDYINKVTKVSQEPLPISVLFSQSPIRSCHDISSLSKTRAIPNLGFFNSLFLMLQTSTVGWECPVTWGPCGKLCPEGPRIYRQKEGPTFSTKIVTRLKGSVCLCASKSNKTPTGAHRKGSNGLYLGRGQLPETGELINAQRPGSPVTSRGWVI